MQPIVVTVDADLADLVPVFLGRRHAEIDRLRELLSAGDFDAIRIIGHSLKGTAGGYGFHGLSDLGADLEAAGEQRKPVRINAAIEGLAAYLACLEVRTG